MTQKRCSICLMNSSVSAWKGENQPSSETEKVAASKHNAISERLKQLCYLPFCHYGAAFHVNVKQRTASHIKQNRK